MFKLGTVANGPGKLRFFGVNTTQEENFTVSTNVNDKLNSYTEYALSRPRRKQFNKTLNNMETAFFASTNSSLG